MKAELERELPEISQQDAAARFILAQRSGKLVAPNCLLVELKTRQSSVESFIRTFRKFADGLTIENLERSRKRIPWAVAEIVETYESLARQGQFADVTPRLRGQPTLGEPGKDALIQFRGNDCRVSRNHTWGELAEAAVRTARGAAKLFSHYDTLRSGALAWAPYSRRRPKGKNCVTGTFYFFEDETALDWPSWLELCRALPPRVKDNRSAYSHVVRALVTDFFAEPDNPRAEEILANIQRTPAGHSRLAAVKQARKSILDCVPRLGA